MSITLLRLRTAYVLKLAYLKLLVKLTHFTDSLNIALHHIMTFGNHTQCGYLEVL